MQSPSSVPGRLLLLIRMDRKDLLSFILQFIRSDISNLSFLGWKSNDSYFSNYFGISIYLGEGSESPVHLGRKRRAFSLLFAQGWGIETDGLEGMEDTGLEPAQQPSVVLSLCAQQKGCLPTRIWKKYDGQGSHKEERMSSKTVSPAFLWGHQNLHNSGHWPGWRRDFSGAVLHKQSFSLPWSSNSWNPVFFIKLPWVIPSSTSFCFLTLILLCDTICL